MHVHIVPLLAFLHMYVCLYVCNQSNQSINQSSGPITITESTFRNYSVFTEIIVVSNSEGGENGNVVQLEVSTPTQSVSITKCTIQGNSYALITLAV